MKNKSHPQVTLKWSRVDEGLLLSAFSAPKASHVYRIAKNYFLTVPDSQELLLDGAKILLLVESTKCHRRVSLMMADGRGKKEEG